MVPVRQQVILLEEEHLKEQITNVKLKNELLSFQLEDAREAKA